MMLQSDERWNLWLNKYFVWLLIVGILANLSGLFITILEPDGALYATIAKEMVQSADFINLKVEGKDWLDKPHFPFWVTALSFKLLGINTVAYKLPALLFWAMGGLYTWLLAKELYSKNIATLSVLIYLTAAHLAISNNDVRAEPYLTGLIIGSVYHFYKSLPKNIGPHLILGSFLAALAAMTKGPFVLIVIASGFIFHWIIRREWREFFHYRWGIAILLISLFIIPEIYCLYRQFDLHPEKVVFGHTGVSGIRFFFWDSQFGRFFNNGPIRGKGDPLFYLHTILWAFLPWSILLIAGVIRIIQHIRKKTSPYEGIIIGTSLITFLLFSLSRFQLPHYMNIVFPFFSIITAQYIYNNRSKSSQKTWFIIQHIILFLLIFLLLVIILYFNMPNRYIIIIILIGLYIAILYFLRKNNSSRIVGCSFLISALFYTFLNTVFYPNLLIYQSGSNAARYINKREPGKIVCTYLENSYSFAFYLNENVEYFQRPELLLARSAQQETLVFTSEDNLPNLQKEGISIKILKAFPHFHISQLTLNFLNAGKRSSVTKKMIVARISKAR
jgi:4-amino-4-deoxy-L-arabinose transferase-like glycosyltransferase